MLGVGLALGLAAHVLGQSDTSGIAASQPVPLAPAAGAAAPATPQPTQADVDAAQQQLALGQGKVDALKQEIADLNGDRDKQNAALIAAVARVKAAETDIASVQNKIGDLIVQELDTRGRLDGADASISNVLAALDQVFI